MTVWPRLTWPSPATTTLLPFLTVTIVVPRQPGKAWLADCLSLITCFLIAPIEFPAGSNHPVYGRSIWLQCKHPGSNFNLGVTYQALIQHAFTSFYAENRPEGLNLRNLAYGFVKACLIHTP
jgi:hypothetical protein